MEGGSVFRRTWQKGMIALARSEPTTRWMQNNRGMRRLAARFVAGDAVETAIDRVRLLADCGLCASLFYLGEYFTDHAEIAETVLRKERAAKSLRDAGFDVNVSVDPTQIGLGVASPTMRENAERIATATGDAKTDDGRVNCLMFDMEDDTTVAATIELHDRLSDTGASVALTLQACLRRTEIDLRSQIARGGRVRLVKGAFVGGADIAFVSNREIKSNYHRLIDLVLSPEAKDTGFYPIIATHDHRLHDYAPCRRMAEAKL